jgi:hypothetical protein
MSTIVPTAMYGATKGTVEVELTPANVALSARERQKVLVVVRNSGPSAARNLAIRSFGDAAVKVVPARFPLATLVPGASVGRMVTVVPTRTGPRRGSVHFVLRYARASPRSPETAVASLRIAERKPAPVGELVRVALKTTLAKLTDRRSAEVVVVVTNIATVPVLVQRVAAVAPAFVRLCAAVGGRSTTSAGARCHEGETSTLIPNRRLEPQESALFDFHADIDHRPQTGKQLVLFNVEVRSLNEARRRSGSVVVPHEFEVAVFGESELLTPLGVPSFLLLPGFLILVTIRLLWQYAWPRPPKPPGLLGAKSIEFWMLAITISLVAFPVYLGVTALGRGGGRNLLDGYGSSDIFWMWGGCVVGGLLLYGLLRTLVPPIQSWWRVRKTPLETDTPERLIVKLARRGEPLRRPQVRFELDGTKPQALVVSRDGDERLLVSPPVGYAFTRRAGNDFMGDFGDAVTGDDIQRIRSLVRRFPHGRRVALSWKPDSGSPVVVPRMVALPVEQQPLRRRLLEQTGAGS